MRPSIVNVQVSSQLDLEVGCEARHDIDACWLHIDRDRTRLDEGKGIEGLSRNEGEPE